MYDDRRTGKTIRATMRALLAASEKPNNHVFIIVARKGHQLHNWNTLAGFATLIAEVRFQRSACRVLLPNGSTVRIRHLEDGYTDWLPGTPKPMLMGVDRDAELFLDIESSRGYNVCPTS